ncbi:MAG TPA: acetate/propionate family kinase, partial [Candidatus Binataceae bacterium]|nr:acetate/propionate family kinase [Candidatus Binataceae bacterium]
MPRGSAKRVNDKSIARAEHVILCINRGSSSLKFSLYRLGAKEDLIASGEVDRIGMPGCSIRVKDGAGKLLREGPYDSSDNHEIFGAIFAGLREYGLPAPVAVGHRIVHGGPHHVAPERVTSKLVAALREIVPFAPLHLPSAIAAIEAIAARFPGLPQVTCFDTAFHHTMPETAARFPLASDLWNEGVRRYGFHGLSYEYIVDALGKAARGRVIIAHLGNGASLAAVRDGIGVDTTMGFTPTGGLMMGTRSGDLDPGLMLYLINEKHYDAAKLEDAVNHAAGLLGVSGLSSDMRTLEESRDPRAVLAREMFCYILRKHIGAMAAALGGVDTLVFTGGIGEHDAAVRWNVCGELKHLGIHLDRKRNLAHRDPISSAKSRCSVRVIPTNEDLVIARHARAIIG